MKKSIIKGYLKELKNNNKNFYFDKSIKILDISNAIYIDITEKYDFKIVTGKELLENYILVSSSYKIYSK